MPFRAFSALIVDDCTHMRTIVSTILRGVGFGRVREAVDGAEALSELRNADYDFLIMDYAMPTLDGIEVTQMLRTSSDSPAPYIPIIMMTAHTERARILGARDAGISELISKPMSAATLINRLAAVVDRPRSWIRATNYTGPCRRRIRKATYTGAMRRHDDQKAAGDGAAA
jgi:two-component system, chemotaxis family, chemotaxis protein CheY